MVQARQPKGRRDGGQYATMGGNTGGGGLPPTASTPILATDYKSTLTLLEQQPLEDSPQLRELVRQAKAGELKPAQVSACSVAYRNHPDTIAGHIGVYAEGIALMDRDLGIFDEHEGPMYATQAGEHFLSEGYLTHMNDWKGTEPTGRYALELHDELNRRVMETGRQAYCADKPTAGERKTLDQYERNPFKQPILQRKAHMGKLTDMEEHALKREWYSSPSSAAGNMAGRYLALNAVCKPGTDPDEAVAEGTMWMQRAHDHYDHNMLDRNRYGDDVWDRDRRMDDLVTHELTKHEI